jgi:3-dehydroquinate synthase
VRDRDPASALPPPSGAVIDQRFAIEVAYPVVFTRGMLREDNHDLAWAIRRLEPERRHRIFAVIDDGVDASWPRLRGALERWVSARDGVLELAADPLVVLGGEAAKNDALLLPDLHRRFQAAHLDRQSVVLAIGGGAMLDAVGYAAATTHRGVRLVRAPSTVLAQNDAGIGVKNGVNAFSTKNFLGTFAPPFAVIDDFELLSTLDARDGRAGIAEAIKVALIRDAEFFEWLEAHAPELNRGEPAAMEAMIRRCAELHLHHIRSAGDPFEQGSARPLDFGHWSAHKLESLSDHGLRHGEAVAIGMALDVRYSAAAGMLPPAIADRICALISAVGLPQWDDALDATEGDRLRVLAGLDEFREHLGGELTITLLRGVGVGEEVHDVDPAIVRACIDELREDRAR